MRTWNEVYAKTRAVVDSLNTGTVWFRGHGSAEWQLLPTLSRCTPTADARIRYGSEESREKGVYHRFVHEAGGLLPSADPWSVAFAMQHHGVPTRLLDWSTVFGVALYFAMRDASADAAVWVLDPYRLNNQLSRREEIFDLSDLPGDYHTLFIQRRVTGLAAAIAFDPPRTHPRVFNQRGGFTLHAELAKPLEDIAKPPILHKIVIPPSAHEGAREFLRLSGISEFALFPDLDGLARDVKNRFF